MDQIVEKEKLHDTFIYLDNVTIAGRTEDEHDQNVKSFLDVVKKMNLTLNNSKTISKTQKLNVLGYQVSH